MIPSELLVSAYASGWFPMAVDPGEIRWYSPDPRGILPLDAFTSRHGWRASCAAARFRIEIDRAFERRHPRLRGGRARRDDDPGHAGSSDEIIESYAALHERGLAHSVEAWQDDRLVGGLYGVALGGAFFGESMFHRETDASKVALVALVERLRARGYELLDTQWVTPHLEQFGAIEIPRGRVPESGSSDEPAARSDCASFRSCRRPSESDVSAPCRARSA